MSEGEIGNGISQAIQKLRDRQSADPTLQAAIDARIAEHEQSRRDDLKRAKERNVTNAAASSGTPRRLFDLLASPEDTEALRATRAWLGGPATFLVLEGGIGTGKTVAAAWAVSRFPAMVEVEGAPGLFRSARSGLFRKSRAVATLSQFDSAAWEELYRTPLLTIDDLGTEALDEKGWALSALLALLDRRYDDAAKTVITTNMSMENIRKRYGQDGGRLFDRLREAGEWVQLGGESMRRAAP